MAKWVGKQVVATLAGEVMRAARTAEAVTAEAVTAEAAMAEAATAEAKVAMVAAAVGQAGSQLCAVGRTNSPMGLARFPHTPT